MITAATITILGDKEGKGLLSPEALQLLNENFEIQELHSISNINQALESTQLLVINNGVGGVERADLFYYIRDKGCNLPTIFLTKSYSEELVESLFSLGVDDIMTAPINTKELIWRIKAILRRAYGIKEDRLVHRDIALDLNRRACEVDGEVINLTKLEFDLLQFFIENRKKILDRNQILEQIWHDPTTKKRTINVRINRLIKKIDPDNTKNYFTAIRGIGYIFD